MNRKLLLLATLLTVGCNAQDVGTLGRVGGKLQARGKKLLLEEPNAKLVKNLPLLQSPNAPPASVQSSPASDESTLQQTSN